MGSSSDIDISIASLYQAWRLFRAGKRPSRAIEEFEYHLENNLLELEKDLADRTYHHGGYRHFVVNDSKRRDIAVATVRDRVVHRLVYEHLVQELDTQFIHHVWSCRRGKGLLGAVKTTQMAMQRYGGGWIWRADIRRFFDSIDYETITTCLSTRTSGERLHSLCREIIASYQSAPGKGLAIGNLTSQILGNVYLHEFDRYILHQLKPRAYVRYGDDFVMWMDDRESILQAAARGTKFLHDKLALELQLSHTTIQPARRKLHYLGLEFFGYQYRLDRRMNRRIQARANLSNTASYEALIRHHMRPRYLRYYAWHQLSSQVE